MALAPYSRIMLAMKITIAKKITGRPDSTALIKSGVEDRIDIIMPMKCVIALPSSLIVTLIFTFWPFENTKCSIKNYFYML